VSTALSLVFIGSIWADRVDLYESTVTAQVPALPASAALAWIGLPMGGVSAGRTLSFTARVTNTGNTVRAFGVGAEVQGPTLLTAPPRASGLLFPGGVEELTFDFTIPSGWPTGEASVVAAAWDGAPGVGTWLAGTSAGIAIAASPFPLAVGKIAYHSTRDLGDPLRASTDDRDGHVHLYDLATRMETTPTLGESGFDRAMNPSFSPDGTRLVFMALPQDAPARRFDEMRVYVYRLSDGVFSPPLAQGQDPKFSATGSEIYFKRKSGPGVYEIAVLRLDDGTVSSLTTSGGEKSGPAPSPDGAWVAFWRGAGESADLWRVRTEGTQEIVVAGTPGLQEYYPAFRDASRLLFTRWETAELGARFDKIHQWTEGALAPERLAFNMPASAGVNDSDAFAVAPGLVGFSTDRSGGAGGYDVVLGDPVTGRVYALPGGNDALHNLGGAYTPAP
jgi:hypothetical protein